MLGRVRTRSPRREWLSVVVVAVVLATLTALVWVTLWTPPTGFAWQGRFLLDSSGLRADVDGTALYVLCAVGGGVLLGVFAAFQAHEPRLTLTAVLVGAGLAAVLMVAWGHQLEPLDAARLAKSAADGTKMSGDLTVVGRAPLLAWPISALASYLLLVLWLTPRDRAVAPESVLADGRDDG
jgi:hypothetical protein